MGDNSLKSLFKKGDMVDDSFVIEYGIVQKVLKTRVHVRYGGKVINYDGPHARQFLKVRKPK